MSSCPGRGQCPEAIRAVGEGQMLSANTALCSPQWGGLWGSRGAAEPQGHGDYWSKATCQKHPLMDGTGPFGSRKGCSSSWQGNMPAGVPVCHGLVCWCAMGWCAGVPQAWRAVATEGQGSNHAFCSPFPPETQTVSILGFPTPKIKEEITVAVGVRPPAAPQPGK